MTTCHRVICDIFHFVSGRKLSCCGSQNDSFFLYVLASSGTPGVFRQPVAQVFQFVPLWVRLVRTVRMSSLRDGSEGYLSRVLISPKGPLAHSAAPCKTCEYLGGGDVADLWSPPCALCHFLDARLFKCPDVNGAHGKESAV